MELRRQEIDTLAFVLGLAALGAATLGFAAAGNGAALVMCALCVTGLIGGRMLGISGPALLAVAVGLDVILWMAWIHPPGGNRETSAIAHFAGGALAGWAIAETLRRRVRWPFWAAAAIIAALGLAVAWEVGEWIGDRILETALIPSKRDSAFDIFFGGLGATAAVFTVRMLLAPGGRSGTRR